MDYWLGGYCRVDDYRLAFDDLGVDVSKETGGPAFPREDYQANGYDDENFGKRLVQEGMHMRDYFAAKAMQGDMAFDPISPGITDEQLAKYVSHYYRIADAMLKARGQ